MQALFGLWAGPLCFHAPFHLSGAYGNAAWSASTA